MCSHFCLVCRRELMVVRSQGDMFQHHSSLLLIVPLHLFPPFLLPFAPFWSKKCLSLRILFVFLLLGGGRLDIISSTWIIFLVFPASHWFHKTYIKKTVLGPQGWIRGVFWTSIQMGNNNDRLFSCRSGSTLCWHQISVIWSPSMLISHHSQLELI